LTAITEADEIVLYTVRHGIEVPNDILKNLAVARKKGPQGRLSEDDQVRFWQSAQTLAKLVLPVTIKSIRATGSAQATIGWSIFSILLLGLLIVTQIFWVVGTNAAANIDGLLKTMADVDADYQSASLAIEASEGALAKAKSNSDTSTPGGSGGEQAKIENIQNEINRAKSARDKSGFLLRDKSEELVAAFRILGNWVSSVPIRLDAGTSKDTDRAREQILLGTAKAILKAMSGYLMPLLYGLLGAAAYVMRSLSREVADVTFTNVSNVRFMLRLVLGMLSGISVGLILTPETLPTTLSAITPLALAFLAGYSVELLFSAMDRLISAFSSEGTRSPSK
jgi:hypothetical protein